jgi:hypothetical protein
MKFTLSVVHGRTMKLSSIARLQDHWWANHRKDLQQGNGGAGCSLVHYRNAEEELHSVVKQLLCRMSQVARLLFSKIYLCRAHIGIYVGTQEILSSKSNTSSSINRSAHPADGRRVKSTPTSSFKSVYK